MASRSDGRAVTVSPRRSFAYLGLGALFGLVSGWVAGLLRAPRRTTRRPEGP